MQWIINTEVSSVRGFQKYLVEADSKDGAINKFSEHGGELISQNVNKDEIVSPQNILSVHPYGIDGNDGDIIMATKEDSDWPSDSYMGVTLLLLQKISDAVNAGDTISAREFALTLLDIEKAQSLEES